MAWEFREAYPDSTILLAREAYNLGLELKLSTDLARPLNFIGIAYNYKGERILAFEAYDEALKVSIQQNDSVEVAYSNNNLGRLFFDQGLLSRSYEYFIQALAIFDDLKDTSGLAYTYQSLANLYKTQRDYPKAEANFLKALKMRYQIGNTRDILSALLQTGRLYQESNQDDKALKYLQLADSAGNVINDEINLAEIKTFIGVSYLHKGMLNEAEAICAEGLKVILQKSNVRMLPQAYLTMGQIQFNRKNFAAARKYFDLSLGIALRSKDLTAKMEAYFWLWKLSELGGSKTEELKNYNQYLILKDSIKDLDLARQVERLQFEIEIERKEKENELLKVNHTKNGAIIQQQKLQNIILIVIIGFVSALGVIQWRNSKKRREVNEKLEEQNQFIQNQRQEIVQQNGKLQRHVTELSDLNHEKDTLMGIVAHDLKSPLNRIKGIADLMEIEGPLTKDQKDYLKMITNATQAGLDLITDLLDVHMLEENVVPNYTTFDMSAFLWEKIEAFKPAAEAKNIHLRISRIESEHVSLDIDYLSRIVDNLISNAIKFSRKDSSINVEGGRKDHTIWISIQDEGPGFSDKDKALLFQKFKKLSARPTAGETSNGLGLAIVKTLIDRLKGHIELVSEQGKGSKFILEFPLNQN